MMLIKIGNRYINMDNITSVRELDGVSGLEVRFSEPSPSGVQSIDIKDKDGAAGLRAWLDAKAVDVTPAVLPR